MHANAIAIGVRIIKESINRDILFIKGLLKVGVKKEREEGE